MSSRYGETHYTRELKRFYDNLRVKYEKAVPIMDDGKFIFEGASFSVKNISVVGLPNINDFVYKLYGMAAGLNPENCNMRPMRTEYNGYSFEINTFDSPKLRTIHLWMLESLIEQAVGRARLLRNNCTVKVFARFPVNQAIVE